MASSHPLDTTAIASREATLLDSLRAFAATFVQRSQSACFVEWIVATTLAVAYVQALFFGELDTLGDYGSNLLPLVIVLGVTRGFRKGQANG